MDPRLDDQSSGRHRGGADRSAAPLAGFDNTSYGTGFADVYDEWYADVSPTATTVELLAELAGTEPILELGVGTGRLALPLAAAVAPTPVWGIDSSPEMLDVLVAKDVAKTVKVVEGDMVAGLPSGPFSLVFVAYNTLFNLTEAADQRACFARVADRLSPGGRFVVEAFVPVEPAGTEARDRISVRSMSADEVVLSITRNNPDAQLAAGQFIELRDGQPVRLRPWAIRYTTVEELDRMAIETGFALENRWADADRSRFDADSTRHISVYRRTNLTAS